MAGKSLKDLLVNELKDIYHAEKQITRALPKMIKNASSPRLKSAFENHLRDTENQVKRLEQVFEELGIPQKGKRCFGMEGIINEGKEKIEELAGNPILDAALISSAQKVEHYEIASYSTVRTYAEALGFDKAADLFQQNLDEEKKSEELLTLISEREINFESVYREAEE